MVLTISTLNVLLRKMMNFICIFVIPFVSDSYLILKEYNGEFLPWSHVTMVRILHLKYSSFHYKLFITI